MLILNSATAKPLHKTRGELNAIYEPINSYRRLRLVITQRTEVFYFTARDAANEA